MTTTPNPTAERWLPVVGYEALYEVSDHGRVRSRGRVDVRGREWLARDMAVATSGRGYKFIYLTSDDGKRQRFSIHRLVALAFIPNPDHHPLVRHWDDDKTNNHVSNLLWGTYADNQADAIRNGKNAARNRTHCPEGHPYSDENTWLNNQGHRFCKTCKSVRPKFPDQRNGMKATCPICHEERSLRRIPMHLRSLHGFDSAAAQEVYARVKEPANV